MNTLRKLTDVREYNICSKEYGIALVKEYVPKDVCRKIRSKNLNSVDKDRILFFLAVIIGLCKNAGSNKIRISVKELGEYLHMKHSFVTDAREFLVSYGFIEAHRCTSGTEFTIKFDINETQNAVYSIRSSEDGVERLFCEPIAETKNEMTIDKLIRLVEAQEAKISTLENENNNLKENIKGLEEELNDLMLNESSRKIEEAKEKSPLFKNAIGRFKTIFS